MVIVFTTVSGREQDVTGAWFCYRVVGIGFVALGLHWEASVSIILLDEIDNIVELLVNGWVISPILLAI